jgi:hypothetical protein
LPGRSNELSSILNEIKDSAGGATAIIPVAGKRKGRSWLEPNYGRLVTYEIFTFSPFGGICDFSDQLPTSAVRKSDVII